MTNHSESGRSMVEMIMAIGIITLLTISGLFIYQKLNLKVQVKAVSERIISLRDQRRLNGIKYSGKHIFKDNEGPFGTEFTVENGIGTQNADFFWITVKKNSASFCTEIQKADVGAKQVEGKNCPEEVTFYFLKNQEDTSVTSTPDKDQQPAVSCPTGRIVDGDCQPCNVNNGTCQDGDIICNSGYYLINDTCKTCQQIDAHATACNDNGTVKECQTDYYLKDNQCKTCPSNATCNGGTNTFICDSGYYKSGETCQSCETGVAECTDATHATSCEENYYLISGLCKTCQQIDTNASTCNNNGTPTTCKSGYYLKNNICTTCPDNATCTNGNTFTCESGYYKSGYECISCGTGVAECTNNANATSCQVNYYLANSQCKTCPNHATCSGGTNTFNCSSGYYKSGEECKICPEHGTCQNNVITCNSGFTLDNESCVLICTQDGECAGCKEINATLPNWDSTKQKCVCSPTSCGTGFYCDATSKECIENPCTIEYSTPNVVEGNQIGSTGCYCKAGYYVNNDTCTACITGATCTYCTNLDTTKPMWNGTECIADVCGGDACCQEMINAGFEMDSDCTEDTCRVTKDITQQKKNTCWMVATESGSYPFCYGNFTINQDLNFQSCTTLFIKGSLTLNRNLTGLDHLAVTGELTINSNKSLTCGSLDTGNALIVEAGAKITTTIEQRSHDGNIYFATTTSEANGLWEEGTDNPVSINRGTIISAQGLQFAGSFKNYGTVTCLENSDIYSKLYEGASLLNYGTFQAGNLEGDATIENNGILNLSGTIKLGEFCAKASNALCYPLTNSGTLNATSLNSSSITQTDGNITIAGDTKLGSSSLEEKNAETAINISGGDVSIGGNLKYASTQKGIVLSGGSSLSISGDVETYSVLSEGPGWDISGNSELIIKGDSSFAIPDVSRSSGIALKLSGKESKIKVGSSLNPDGQYSIWQTGGEIIACGGTGINSDSSSGIYITEGTITSQKRIYSCIRETKSTFCTKTIYYDNDPNSENYNSHIVPYATIPWCTENGY